MVSIESVKKALSQALVDEFGAMADIVVEDTLRAAKIPEKGPWLTSHTLFFMNALRHELPDETRRGKVTVELRIALDKALRG